MLTFFTAAISVLRGKTGGMVASLFVSGFGLGMLVLSLPLYLKKIGASTADIGLTLSMFGAGMLLFELVWGWAADRYGVPIPLILSRFFFALAMLGFAFATTIPQFAVLYLLSSGMMVAGAPLGRSFLAISVSQEKRGLALGFYAAQMNLGLAIGSVLAGLIADNYGLEHTFRIAFVFPLLSGFIALLTFRGQYRLKLTRLGTQRPQPAAGGPRFAYVWPMVITSSVVTLMLIGFSGERAFLPILSTGKLQLSATDAGLIMSVLGLTGGFLMVPCGNLADRFGRKPMMTLGLVLGIGGLLIYPVATGFTIVLAAAFIRGVAVALVWPAATTLLADTIPRSRQGLMMGIYGEFENVGTMMGPILAGFAISASSIEGAFVALAVTVGISLIATLVLVRERWSRAALGPEAACTAS